MFAPNVLHKSIALVVASMSFVLGAAESAFKSGHGAQSAPSGILSGPVNSVVAPSEWEDFSKQPSAHLRGYKEELFPPPSWALQNGCFQLDSTGFGSDLMTRSTYENFELEFDWKFVPGGNSGIIFAVQPGYEYSYLTGPEVQLLDDAKHPDGKKAITSLGALYGLTEPDAEAKKKLALKEFSKCRLIVNGNELKFYVNDVLVSDLSLDPKVLDAKIAGSKFKNMKNFYKQRSGHIVFQDHGGKTEFCRVRIRRL
jgi:hypothetical protein